MLVLQFSWSLRSSINFLLFIFRCRIPSFLIASRESFSYCVDCGNNLNLTTKNKKTYFMLSLIEIWKIYDSPQDIFSLFIIWWKNTNYYKAVGQEKQQQSRHKYQNEIMHKWENLERFYKILICDMKLTILNHGIKLVLIDIGFWRVLDSNLGHNHRLLESKKTNT